MSRRGIPVSLGILVVAMVVLVAQLCPTLCDPTDCSPPGSSVHGVLQARILEWVAISFSRWLLSRTRNSIIFFLFLNKWQNFSLSFHSFDKYLLGTYTNLPARLSRIQSLIRDDPLEKGMASLPWGHKDRTEQLALSLTTSQTRSKHWYYNSEQNKLMLSWNLYDSGIL